MNSCGLNGTPLIGEGRYETYISNFGPGSIAGFKYFDMKAVNFFFIALKEVNNIS